MWSGNITSIANELNTNWSIYFFSKQCATISPKGKKQQIKTKLNPLGIVLCPHLKTKKLLKFYFFPYLSSNFLTSFPNKKHINNIETNFSQNIIAFLFVKGSFDLYAS
jgi:hypothetical protein